MNGGAQRLLINTFVRKENIKMFDHLGKQSPLRKLLLVAILLASIATTAASVQAKTGVNSGGCCGDLGCSELYIDWLCNNPGECGKGMDCCYTGSCF